jgi:hypothetical protein
VDRESHLFSSDGPDSKVIKPAASGQNHGAKVAGLSSIHLPELSEDFTEHGHSVKCNVRADTYTYDRTDI